MSRTLLLAPLVALGTALLPAGGRDDRPPSPPREFRGVWVATVANIDWPSKKGLPAERQQAELRAILDKAVALRLNAVVLQVRPMCDALYESKLEPWSEYLTGTPGKPPQPFYDPLAFAVREAHARGLELHAWFNPYRAWHPSAKGEPPPDHIVKRRPDLAKKYGTHYWLNPTSREVQDYSIGVILDVVRRYDVDGVHLDDYFYPYKEKNTAGEVIPFPDDDTWAAYQKAGGRLGRDDWRREAVNQFVSRLYREVKSAKAWVKVGISPFGIWRPGHPPGIEGFDQYAGLYADAKLWLNEGWIDYWSPQLYWPIKQTKQSYPKLLAWWAGENTKHRHLWPGLIPSRVTGTERGWPAQEIADQIRATRAQAGASGEILFSMKSLLRNTGGVSDVLAEVYTEPALVPASPWLGGAPPAKPTVKWQDRSVRIGPAGDGVRLFVVRATAGGKWTIRIQPAGGAQAVAVPVGVPMEGRPGRVVVTAVDRIGLESEPAELGK